MVMPENKISRICWNTNGWRKPSGSIGKSKNKKAYEDLVGYGHEEWLLDTTKLIDGWHYGFLQPIGLHRDKYVGKKFNISLYSINNQTKGRWWIGEILGVVVITPEESSRIYTIYKQNGWLKEMEEQLLAVGADAQNFRKTPPDGFAVVKYKPNSAKLLDIPLGFSASDTAVTSNYYTLLNKKQDPELILENSEFSFSPGHNQKKASTQSSYENKSSEIDLVHNVIQTNIYKQLIKKYGEQNVGTEQQAGYGSKIDIVVRDKDNKYIFFEIKTSYSVRLCIREALGQLLEYAYLSKNSGVKKLVVVSPNIIKPEIISYLQNLREHFNIPIHYQRYLSEDGSLENIDY